MYVPVGNFEPDTAPQVYLYNWSAQATGSLREKLNNLVQWNALRKQFLSTVFNAKMGLFHHAPFDQDEIKFESLEDVELVVREAIKPKRQQLKKLRTSDSNALPIMSSLVAQFPKDLPDMADGNPVKRHGQQLLKFLVTQAKEQERKAKILDIFQRWESPTSLYQTLTPRSVDVKEVLVVGFIFV